MRAWCVYGLLVASLAAGWSTLSRAQTQLPASAPPPVRTLQLDFHQGKVTLVAHGVTVRDIMAEWARKCGCVVQGVERLPSGSAVVMEFENAAESVVLESLLRGAGGYMFGPRLAGSEGASIYGSVAVFPVSHGTASAYVPSSYSPVAAPVVSGSVDDEIPPVTPAGNPQTPGQTSGRSTGPAVPIVPANGTTTTPTGRGRGGFAPR